MGILDEAIREHLELKRQHGADDSELQQLEDQAFGLPERPGTQEESAAEAPTEFMSRPDMGGGGNEAEQAEQELGAESKQESAEPPAARRAPAAGLADLQEAPQMGEDEPAEQTPGDEPVAEESGEERSAAEHEAIAPSAGSHTTEERRAIADQPTEMFDVEEDFAPSEVPAPPDEDLVAEEIGEARLGPAEPDAPLEVTAADEDEDDDFFDEQRLSDELDQALEVPAERVSDEPKEIVDEPEAVADHTEEHEPAEPRTEMHKAVPETEEHQGAPAEKSDSDEDVLEETPDFLEEAPEDDQLWFEQKPPKDFDFDD